MTKKEFTKDFYSFFCLLTNLRKLFRLHVLLSQQEYKNKQNNLHFSSKTPLAIIVRTSTLVFIISNLDKGVTNNLTIVMRKLHQGVLLQILDSLLIQRRKHCASKMQELNLQLLRLFGTLNVNFMDQIHIFNQEQSHLLKIIISE